MRITADTSPCPLLTGEGSPRLDQQRLHPAKSYPRCPNPCLFSPRSARPRGLSRGIVRPGGVCGFRRARPLRAEGGGGADRHRAGESGRATCDTDNQKAIWSAQKTCARDGAAAVGAASTRHSTSTSARSRRLRRHHRPAHPLGYALESPKTPRSEPAGAFGASWLRPRRVRRPGGCRSAAPARDCRASPAPQRRRCGHCARRGRGRSSASAGRGR